MKKILKSIVVFVLLSAFFPNVFVSALSAKSKQASTEVSAASYYLMDGLTYACLGSKNENTTLPMASTTKVMTCIIALENASPSDEVVIPKEAVGVEGSSVYLVVGERLTLEELLYALMLESANDAAVAIAMHVSGDVDSFVELMNCKAIELGMFGTNYANPHGLPADQHYSTAKDLCLLLSYALKNVAFRVYSGTQKTTISAPNSSHRFLANHNKLLRVYDPCIAGKTGFTKEAGRCLVTASEKNGRTLICATLGDPNDWNDHVSLYNYGFSLYEENQILSDEELSISVPVVGGTKESVLCKNKIPISFWMKAGEEHSLKLELPSFVYADVIKDDVLGYAVFSIGETEVQRIELFADETVLKREESLTFWGKLLQKIRLWME